MIKESVDAFAAVWTVRIMVDYTCCRLCLGTVRIIVGSAGTQIKLSTGDCTIHYSVWQRLGQQPTEQGYLLCLVPEIFGFEYRSIFVVI